MKKEALKKWSDLDARERDKLVKDYKKMTGPEACRRHGVDWNSVKNSLSRAYPKAEHGGARKGAGNKKGIKFCGGCRQREENCKCDK